ncbi:MULTISPECIES: hypothetical protein [unclassified Actinotalea]|uniref:hypothetical protein n=1 Tax=unclassified Actinotalea TaxID=2638618 RepID=UPI0015F55166|nr:MULTISPECIES: hypothetical protein [unclassified Actinotalea]
MTDDAPLQPLPDPGFTPADDGGVELGSEADETEPPGSTDPDAPLDGGASRVGNPEKDPQD